MKTWALLLCLAVLPLAARAQTTVATPVPMPMASTCGAIDNRRLPGEFAPLAGEVPLIVAGRVAAEGAVINAGEARAVTLLPQSEVRFIVPSASKPLAEPHAGALRLHVVRAGIYRIALGASASIDVIGHGSPATAINAVAQAPGPQCSVVRKIVDVQLEAGDYLVQLSNASEVRILIMAVIKR